MFFYRMSQHPLRPNTRRRSYQVPLRKATSSKERQDLNLDRAYRAWLASREGVPHRKNSLAPSGQRSFNCANAQHAMTITKHCAYDFCKVLIRLHPGRTTLMLCLNVVRSLSPAYRGYWQAVALNELQALISAGNFSWIFIIRLVASELLRRISEGLLESFAASNENIVHASARYFVEYQQMEQRVRLDLPTLADPNVRDLLQESELFARSFNGGSGFGLLSPFDVVHIISLCMEVVSQIWVLITLTGQTTHSGVLLISVLATIFPLVFPCFGLSRKHADPLYTPREAFAAERQQKMRTLAYSDSHRQEILLFGLGPWILRTWAAARRVTLSTEQPAFSRDSLLSPSFLLDINISDLFSTIQNIPLVFMLQSSSASLGSVTLHRNSIQSVVFAIGNLISTMRMAYQSVFLMGAFCIAMKIQPRLHPKQENCVEYRPSSKGVEIDLKNVSYTYPGSNRPALNNASLHLNAGETLAVVGYNGSGKSTLAKILLRILDFDQGELTVNGVDIRKYNPAEYHSHISAVFQGFSRFDATAKENVGVGFVDQLQSRVAVENAVKLAGADAIIKSLPNGLRTHLDSNSLDSASFVPPQHPDYTINANVHHGLSGGEWQRIAISRAFMRAHRPEIDLLLFDEPTSALDAHAQNHIFDTIDKISRSPSGEKVKTVIFITHRLSTARRADKIAMMENGMIIEFGTHEQLLRNQRSYASLYQASI